MSCMITSILMSISSLVGSEETSDNDPWETIMWRRLTRKAMRRFRLMILELGEGMRLATGPHK